jgi:hypothetical protein
MPRGASKGDDRNLGGPVKLSQAATRFVASLSGERRKESQAEVHRFARWFGADRPIGDLRAYDVELYAKSLGAGTPDVMRRAEIIRSFLTFAKKERLTSANLAPALRLSKAPQAAELWRHRQKTQLTRKATLPAG